MTNEYGEIFEPLTKDEFRLVSHKTYEKIFKKLEKTHSFVGGSTLQNINDLRYENFMNDFYDFDWIYAYTDGKEYILYLSYN